MTGTIETELRAALGAVRRVRDGCRHVSLGMGCRIAVYHELGGAEQSIGRVLHLICAEPTHEVKDDGQVEDDPALPAR